MFMALKFFYHILQDIKYSVHRFSFFAMGEIIVGFTRIAVNFKFHSWFANFKLT